MSKSVNWDPEEDDIIRNLMKYFLFYFLKVNKMRNISGHKLPLNYIIIIMGNLLELLSK